MSTLDQRYRQLCTELGDCEYQLEVLNAKKSKLLAEIGHLDRLAGELKALSIATKKEHHEQTQKTED